MSPSQTSTYYIWEDASRQITVTQQILEHKVFKYDLLLHQDAQSSRHVPER